VVKNSLSDTEYRQILAGIQAIHECRRLDDFPQHVLRELRKVVECHLAGYNEVDLPRNKFVVVFDPPRPDLVGPLFEKFAALMHEHPVITYFDKTGDGQALKMSDFLTTREYHGLALYRDCYRHVEVEDQISFSLRISPGFMIGIALNRNRRSFTEKERLSLNLMRPHIIQAYLRLAEIVGRRECQQDIQHALRDHGLGVIAVNTSGDVIHSTPGAFECLARYLPVPEGCTDDLPARLKEWLRVTDGAAVAEPMIICRNLNRLIVRHAPSHGRRLLLLSEENNTASLSRVDRFGLTPREREVLRWIAEGKANAEIAVILGLNAGTVKLHVERILDKMGVDNRVMAALLFHGIVL
jgi:DNA-binding CsgD family transcriptional regulator